MNKIYKVVWNEVKNCYSVVSEIAKSHGKSSSHRKKTMVALMVFSLLSAGGLSYAEPTLTSDQQAVYDAVLQKLEREKKTVHYVSVNSDSSANPAGSNYNNDGATGNLAMAIGLSATAKGEASTALGRSANAQGLNSVALGFAAKAGGDATTALGFEAKAEGNSSTALGYLANAQGNNSMVLGYLANAQGNSSTALGFASTTEGESSMALGHLANAQGNSSTALGNKASAYGNQSQATGKNAWSIGGYSQASGYNAVAAAEKGIDEAAYNALSEEEKQNYTLNTQSEGKKDTSLYYRTKFKEYTKDEFNALPVMERHILESEQGYTYDKEKQVWRRSPGAVAVGHAAKAIGLSTLAVGDLAEATAKYAVAVGREAEATDVGNTALGYYAKAKGLRSTALGVATRATDFESMAVGPYAWAEGKVSLALGSNAHAKGNNSIAMGRRSESTGESSIALGGSAKTQEQGSVAIGMMAESRQKGSVALGEVSLADRKAGVWGLDISTGQAMNEDALLGAGKAAYDEAKAKLTELEGQEQTLRNQYNASLAQDPVGTNGNHIPSAATQAIGNQLRAKENEVNAQAIRVNDTVKAWKATEGAVSVGNTGFAVTRQITGLAAGTEDTDAVNVAQLKKVNTKVDKNATDITNLGTKVEQNKTDISNIEQNITNLTTKVNKGAVHYFGVKSDEPAVPAGTNWDGDGATGRNAMAVGPWAKASGQNALALGISSSATHVESTAVGSFVKAEGAKSAAFGTEAHAKGDTSIAAGLKAEAIGKGSIALGSRTKAQADGSIVMGSMAESRQNGSVALGAGSLADRNAEVWGLDIATGQVMNEDTLLGAGKADYEEAKAKLAELQGQAQTLMGEYEASLARDPMGPNGYPVESAATQAIKNKLDAKIAEVSAQTIQVKNAVNVWQSTQSAISIGNKEMGLTRQITGLAAGTEDTDAVNVAQLKKVNTKVDTNTTNITNLSSTVEQNKTDISNLTTKVNKGKVRYFSVNAGEPAVPAGTNWNGDGATGQFATAVGPWTKASGQNSLALGVSSSATHVESTAVGSFVKAEGAKSAAFGTEAHAKGDTSIAIGPNSESIGKSSIALGGRAKSQADGSVSIGMMAESRQAGSVALGAGSIVDRKADVWGLDISTGQAMNEDTLLGAGKAAYDEAKVKLTELQGQAQTLEREYQASLAQDPKGPNGYPVESAATQAIKNKLDAKMGEVFAKTMEVKNAVNTWSATEGAISVGSTERAITRQITGVAAGKEDTDAVNVAQLKRVAAMAKSATVDIEAGDNNVTVNKDTTTGKYKISAKDTKLKENANALSISNGKLNLAIEDTDGKKVTGSVDLSSIQGAAGAGKTYTMTGTQDSATNTTTIALQDNNGNEQKVVVATKDTNTYTTGATYDAGSKKLTFTRNDKKTYDVDLSGIAGSITGDTRNTIVESDTIGVDSTSKNADGSINYKLNVKTNGKVEKDNKGIVTGGTVYKETRIEKDGKYVKKDKTAGDNLSALDKQVGINTEKIQKLGSMDNRIGELGAKVGELGTRVDKVGAGAAALAGLHPLDYDPDNKIDFAAGYGHYKGANALAIGAFYRPDENKMISIGGSFGGGENMVSAGVSVKLGQGTGISTSKVAMAKEIKNLKTENERMQAENKEMKQEIEVLKEQMQKLLAGK